MRECREPEERRECCCERETGMVAIWNPGIGIVERWVGVLVAGHDGSKLVYCV